MKTQLQALPSLLSTPDSALEVRAEDATLLARGTASHVADVVNSLNEGSYILTCTSPAGAQVSGLIQLSHDGQVDISDSLAAELSSHREIGPQRGSSILASAAALAIEEKPDTGLYDLHFSLPARLEPMGPAPLGEATTPGLSSVAHPEIQSRQFSVIEAPEKRREIFWRAFVGTTPSLSELRSSALGLRVFSDRAELRNESDTAVTLQLLDVGESALNIIIPPLASIVLTASPRQRRPSIAAYLNVPLADDMLAVRQDGRLLEFTAMAASVRPQSIIDIAASNESAAVAVAFAVLRAGRMDVAIEVLRELNVEAAPSPDIVILGGEIAAREGRYEAAMASFGSAANAPLPMFSFALSYLLDRLRFFAMTRPERQAEVIEPDFLERKQFAPPDPAVQRIQAFSSRCNFGIPFTNYTGLDPLGAGDALLTEADILNSQAQLLMTFPTSR